MLAAASGLWAATPRDNEIELMETTYRVQPDNTAEITYHQRWRALSAQGRTNLSQIHVGYSAGSEELEFRFVRTLKKSGAVIEGNPASAVESPISTDALAPLFTDEKVKTIIPPDLETGDAVEYEAVRHVHQFPKAGDFWLSHDLTRDARVLSETVVLDLPAERRISIYEDPRNPGKVETSGGRRIERWSVSKPEPAKPQVERSGPLFVVSSIASWDAVGNWVLSLNKVAAEPTPEIAALAAKLTENQISESGRIAALYSYVATKVRYVGIDLGNGFQPHPAATVLHNAYGDCKDQSALLMALLGSAGFKAYPVLATPGSDIPAREVPAPLFSHQFTAVETKAGRVFLDTSMGPVSPQVLAPGVRGRSALVVGEGKSAVVDIPAQSPVPTKFTAFVRGRVTAAGVFEGSAQFEFQGLAELSVRRSFLDSTDAEKEAALKGFNGLTSASAIVRQIVSSDPADLSKPFHVECEINDKDFFPTAKSSKKVGSPLHPLAGLLGLAGQLPDKMPEAEKPFPVDRVSLTDDLDLIVDPALVITTGMGVHLKTAFGSFDSEYTYLNGHLTRKRTLEFNGNAIAPTEWSGVVEFLRSTATELGRGFDLERHTVAPGLTGLTKALREGADAYQRRDYEGAKRAYLEATRLDPKSTTAWNDLGRAYNGLRDYDNAERPTSIRSRSIRTTGMRTTIWAWCIASSGAKRMRSGCSANRSRSVRTILTRTTTWRFRW